METGEFRQTSLNQTKHGVVTRIRCEHLGFLCVLPQQETRRPESQRGDHLRGHHHLQRHAAARQETTQETPPQDSTEQVKHVAATQPAEISNKEAL